MTPSLTHILWRFLAVICALRQCWAGPNPFSLAYAILSFEPSFNVSVDWKDPQYPGTDRVYAQFGSRVVESELFVWQQYAGNATGDIPIPTKATSYVEVTWVYGGTGEYDGGGYLYLHHAYSQPGTYAPTYNISFPARTYDGRIVNASIFNQCWNKEYTHGSDCIPDSFTIHTNRSCSRVVSSAVSTWSVKILVLISTLAFTFVV
jgi:hypothetical protein